MTTPDPYTGANAPLPEPKRLYRSRNNSMIGGIFAGLSERYGWDPTLIRVLGVLSVFVFTGTPILVYLILWLVIPRQP